MNRPATAALLSALLALTGCAEVSSPAGVPAAAEVARLKSLGFRSVAGTGGTEVLSYSGPVTAAVACQWGSGGYGPIPARRGTSGGGQQEITLDAYLLVTPGADGVLAAQGRDGVYAVSIVTRPAGSRRAETVEMFSFGPRGSGRARSGLSCRPA